MSPRSTVYKIENERALSIARQKGVVKLYQDVFADPPYEEFFTNQEVVDCLLLYVLSGLFLAAENTNEIIGFAAAIPLLLEREIAALAAQQGFDPTKSWYFAELGVRKDQRRKGEASSLIRRLITQIPADTILMRTAAKNIASQRVNQQLGFTIVDGMQQAVSQTRQNGQIVTDQRIFLAYEKKPRINNQ